MRTATARAVARAEPADGNLSMQAIGKCAAQLALAERRLFEHDDILDLAGRVRGEVVDVPANRLPAAAMARDAGRQATPCAAHVEVRSALKRRLAERADPRYNVGMEPEYENVEAAHACTHRSAAG
jgi:hypothetical protein